MEAIIVLIGIVVLGVAPIVLFVGAVVVGWINAGRRMRGERGILESDD